MTPDLGARLGAHPHLPAVRLDRAGRLVAMNAPARRLRGEDAPAGAPLDAVLQVTGAGAMLAAGGAWQGEGAFLRPGELPLAVRLDATPDAEGLWVVATLDVDAVLALQADMGALNSKLVNLNRERAKQAAELAAANRRLTEADQLKTRFYASMSHELRTPLSSIIGFSEDALDGMAGPLGDDLKQYFTTIHKSAVRQLALITDVLDLAKLEVGRVRLDRRPTALAEIAAELEATMRPLVARKQQALAVDVDPALPLVDADPEQLYQIGLNLLSNAHKYTPPGGRLVFSARREGGVVKACVADDGPGIPEGELPYLFEEFYRAGFPKKKGGQKAEGTGLGLAITRKLVELHGGAMWAESAEGAGAAFCFTLPVAVC